MAIKKEIINGFGIPVSYWKISRITPNKESIDVELTGYYNKDAREGNKGYLDVRNFNIPVLLEEIKGRGDIYLWAVENLLEFYNAEEI